MKNKIILILAALVLLLELSSCRMHEARMGGNYFQPTRTRHHWSRERKMNVRHQFWGRHRAGMKPYKNRGQVRF